MEGEQGEWGNSAGIKKNNLWLQSRQEEVKNSIGNEEAKELICTIHGHELRGRDRWREGGYWVEGGKGGKIGTTVVAKSIKCT